MKHLLIWFLMIVLTKPIAAQETKKDKIDDLLTAYQKLNIFNGTALVYSNDKPILIKGYGYRNFEAKSFNDSNTIFQIASVTKPFTSTLILKLVQLKQLSLNDKLNKFYPDFPNGNKITIKNLLTHTSGIYDYTHDDTAVTNGSEQKMMNIFKTHKLDFEPGTDWSYSNSGYSILGYIIQKVTGITYEQAIRKYIFQPAAMKNSGFDFEHLVSKNKSAGYSVYSDTLKSVASFSDSSTVFAAGAIYSTVKDLYQFHKALQSYIIIDKYLLDKAYTPYKHNYGYGWIIDTINGNKMVYHSGGISGYSSIFIRIPQENICIVLLNNKEGIELENIGRKILKILYNQSYVIPVNKVAIRLPENILNKYAGTYELTNPNLQIEIKLDSGKLMAHAINGPTFELFAETQKLFGIVQQNQVEIEFITDQNGNVTQLILHQNDQNNMGKKIK